LSLISDWDVSLVPPEVFAGALSRLEKVVFEFESGVTRAQLEALFMLMFSQQEAGGSKLKILGIAYTDLSSVSPEILVGAIQRLERVVVVRGLMTAEQITAIFIMLKENQQGRLKEIWIYSLRFDGSVSATQEIPEVAGCLPHAAVSTWLTAKT